MQPNFTFYFTGAAAGRPAPPTGGAAAGGDGNGNGNGGAPVGRGAMRGRRQIESTFFKTRPAHLATKQGKTVCVSYS